MSFIVSLTSVAVMLAYAIPGFIFVKGKFISEGSISAFAKVLMYLCQPALAVYAFMGVDFSMHLLANMGIFLALTAALQTVMLVTFYFALKKKSDDVRYRVCTVATTFGNCSFMGIPLLDALLPEYPEARIYSIVFFVGMSILGWTLGSFIITRDKKYISIKQVLLNPGVISVILVLPLFIFSVRLPAQIGDMITVLGKMTTPLCMLVMGMRLATVRLKPLFCDPLQYVTVGIKQVIMPLLGMLIIWFLPVDLLLKQTMVILCACPVASVVLNFAEILGEGQETAANTVLLGTLLSVLSIPLILLLV